MICRSDKRIQLLCSYLNVCCAAWAAPMACTKNAHMIYLRLDVYNFDAFPNYWPATRCYFCRPVCWEDRQIQCPCCRAAVARVGKEDTTGSASQCSTCVHPYATQSCTEGPATSLQNPGTHTNPPHNLCRYYC
eukprot:1150451-Pelagomonas_calceolata.AAC.4